MGLLDRSRSLRNKVLEDANKERSIYQAAQSKDAGKRAARILGVDEKDIDLTEMDHDWYFTLDALDFKVTWSHRGYDNLGGGMFWELYVKVAKVKFYGQHLREEGQWCEVKTLTDIVKWVDIYGL